MKKSDESVGSEALTLRPATSSDSAFLLALRNDPIVRANSFQKGEVRQEDHERWLSGVLADPARHLYILETGDGPAGQVRIDVAPSGEAEISYSIAGTFRGRGYGNQSIALIEQEVRQNHPEVRMLTAEVIPGNAPSCRVFEKNGYILTDKTQAALTFRKTL